MVSYFSEIMGGLRGSVEGFIMLPTAVKLVTDDSDRSTMGKEHGFCIRPGLEAQLPITNSP